MEKNKTIQTDNSVTAFINTIRDNQKRNDFTNLIEAVSQKTGYEPKLWGTAIVGFGSYHYKYDSGREGDAPIVGMAARANAIVIYLSANFENREELLKKLGKHKTEKGCVYIKGLHEINVDVLMTMVENHRKHIQELYS